MGGGRQQREDASSSSSVLPVGTPAPDAGSQHWAEHAFPERRFCQEGVRARSQQARSRGSLGAALRLVLKDVPTSRPRRMVGGGKTPERAKRPSPAFRKHTGRPDRRGQVGHGAPQRRAEPGVH